MFFLFPSSVSLVTSLTGVSLIWRPERLFYASKENSIAFRDPLSYAMSHWKFLILTCFQKGYQTESASRIPCIFVIYDISLYIDKE